MGHRRWWILAVAIAVAIVTWSLLALRGPDTSRAPGRDRDAGPAPANAAPARGGDAAGTAAIRLIVHALPSGSRPEWTLEAHDSTGGVHTRRGTGGGEHVLGSLPGGQVRCIIRAPGFLGETIRIDAVERRDCAGVLRVRRFGSVTGVAREGEVPVSGALIRLAMSLREAKKALALAPEDGEPAIEWTTETDADGGFRFERIPPLFGYTIHAAHFDYPVVRVDSIRVAPGAATSVTVPMERAGHLAGRVIDQNGKPCAGVTVHIYERKPGWNAVEWKDEARARTEKDGRFVTPALRGQSVRMLKSWVLADDLHLVMQIETVPPEEGRKDVGDLRPHPGTVRFETESEVGGAGYALTVAAVGDPPGQGPVVVLNGLKFTPDGCVRVAGLPAGECNYFVLDARNLAVCDGSFRVTGGDLIVHLPPFGERAAADEDESEEEYTRLRVHGSAIDEEAMVIVADSAAVVAWQRVAKGQVDPSELALPAGGYRVYLRAGGRIGWTDVIHTATRDSTISVAAVQPGREYALRVLRGGEPLPGAEIWIRGFRAGATGIQAPWVETDAEGRALLRGLPPDATVLEIAVLKGGSGRRYAISIGDEAERTLDLEEQLPD